MKNNIRNLLILILCNLYVIYTMELLEKIKLKNKVLEMFDHGYSNYMKHAYPADELMPLSCSGRYRGSHESRGDMDDSLGNFSLTLVDTLDTLVVLGRIDEFAKAVNLTLKDVSFDRDVVVSVFETNIRMMGGLLSAHIFASDLAASGVMYWYHGELLDLARDLGDRLLPAFNTSTGIPYPKVNLRYGVTGKHTRTGKEQDTCTACGGSMILEFAALSRLTGNKVYENKAHKAMEYLWKSRHRGSDLVGTIINIHNGDWIRKESGVGAGIDSYYEYMLKAYVLLGDKTYLSRFNTHYSAIAKYIDKGHSMRNVQMHNPHMASRNFMDALLAFWPGLQVLKGDIKSAIRLHEMLYQVIQEHNFLPEAFTKDFQVHWGFYRLRPEFIESTYFLYKATGDDHYLEVGKQTIENLEKYARVKCGFASIGDIKTWKLDDQMDSYILAETFKYLYLLYAEDSELSFDINKYVFTTEAHLLPLSLANHNGSIGQKMQQSSHEMDLTIEHAMSCPNLNRETNIGFALSIRQGMQNLIQQNQPVFSFVTPKSNKRLRAHEFISTNPDHLQELSRMGISIQKQFDGRLQLALNINTAESELMAQHGSTFMGEMIELSKQKTIEEVPLQVQILLPLGMATSSLFGGSAQFGRNLHKKPIAGTLVDGHPSLGCHENTPNSERFKGKIVLLKRGDCMFIEKARILEKWGAIGGVIMDNVAGSSFTLSPLFSLSGDGGPSVDIPLVFLYSSEANSLMSTFRQNKRIDINIGDNLLSKDQVNQYVKGLANPTATAGAGTAPGSLPSQEMSPKTPDASSLHRSSDKEYTTLVNKEYLIAISTRKITCKWNGDFNKKKITVKMSYKSDKEFAINVYMDSSLPRSIPRFTMAAKIVRLLTAVVTGSRDSPAADHVTNKEMSLTSLASDSSHEHRVEFKAFVKMCQAIFSNIDISGDSSWRALIGTTPVTNREIRRVEMFCTAEDQRLANLLQQVKRSLKLAAQHNQEENRKLAELLAQIAGENTSIRTGRVGGGGVGGGRVAGGGGRGRVGGGASGVGLEPPYNNPWTWNRWSQLGGRTCAPDEGPTTYGGGDDGGKNGGKDGSQDGDEDSGVEVEDDEIGARKTGQLLDLMGKILEDNLQDSLP